MRVPVILLMSLLAVSLLAAGCGGSDDHELDARHISAFVEEGIHDQLNLTMSVECPTGIEKRKGGKFTCTATSSDHDEFRVHVTQRDAKGNVDWKADILPTGPIERSIAEEIFSKRAIRVTLDCPVAVPLDVDEEFECKAEDDKGRTQKIYATITDDNGNISWRT